MLDIGVVLLTVVFFVACELLVHGLDSLRGGAR